MFYLSGCTHRLNDYRHVRHIYQVLDLVQAMTSGLSLFQKLLWLKWTVLRCCKRPLLFVFIQLPPSSPTPEWFPIIPFLIYQEGGWKSQDIMCASTEPWWDRKARTGRQRHTHSGTGLIYLAQAVVFTSWLLSPALNSRSTTVTGESLMWVEKATCGWSVWLWLPPQKLIFSRWGQQQSLD